MKWTVLLIAFAVPCLTPSAVVAASSDLQAAQAAIDRASRLYTRADYEGALTALREAEALAEKSNDPSLPNIRFNIARCLEKLERWPEALGAYEAYNELPDASHRKQRAFNAIRALETKVFATLSVACDPAGSSVEISGLVEGTPSCPWSSTRVPAGSYAVKVTHPGYLPTTELVDVEVGNPVNVQVSLERDPDSSAALVAAAPRKPFRPWPWAALAGSAAAIGVGAGFTAGASNAKDLAESLPPGTERDDAVSDFETKRGVSYAMYGVAGALAVTGVVLFFVRGDRGEASEGEAGLAVTGSGLTVKF